MIILSENNLGKRQKELNEKVQEAVKSNVKLADLPEVEGSDVDKIFKIDIASIYKNVDYIIRVLKSGDSLYISRALKCTWIYDNDHAHIINPDYLQTSIFPEMSAKMKNKMLSAIATHVRDEKRAYSFYAYCKNMKMESYANKFLIFTSEEFKAQQIKEGVLLHKELDYIKNYIGNSFNLASVYIDNMFNDYKSHNVLQNIRHMYSVSNETYLDLVEKHHKCQFVNLGVRLSKDVMRKHKKRVLQHPRIYLSILHPKMITEYSTTDDAKYYLKALMPCTAEEFLESGFNTTHKHILALIPTDEVFLFVKKLFTERYKGYEFEMDKRFYDECFYELMTIDQREEWALRHLANNTDLLGFGNNYKWYQFVRFEKAFPGIKKFILITADKDKRKEIVKTLIHTPRDMRDVENLLNYYYERHINEAIYDKVDFIDMLLQHHNVYKFDENCWKALEKIFCSMEIYIASGHNNCQDSYRYLALIYHIIHDKEVPKGLKQFIDNYFDVSTLKRQCDSLDAEKMDIVFEYLLEYYLIKIKTLLNEPKDNEMKIEAEKYIYNSLNLISSFAKNVDKIPQNVNDYIKENWEDFKRHELFYVEENFQEDDLFRGLKNDAKSIVNELPKIKKAIDDHWIVNLRKLYRKLKTYFPKDVCKDYLNYFNGILTENNENTSMKVIHASVFAIFELADEGFKTEFMMKYAPTEQKIDHANINRNLLYTQEGICRFACYSRVPVPLEKILMYIKGDYIHYCLPMFNRYLAQLPLPLCLNFAKALLDTPLSVQKHAVRLAFKCFSVENMVTLVEDIWKKSKNISLRFIIYKTLFEKVVESEYSDLLFEVLKSFTQTIHPEDDPEIFNVMTSNRLPEKYCSDYLEVSWITLEKIQSSAFLQHKVKLIKQMEGHIRLMKKSFVLSIIEEHIKHMLVNKNAVSQYCNHNYYPYYIEEYDLNKAKLDLTTRFIVAFDDKESVEKAITLVKSILNPCFEMWDEASTSIFCFRRYFSEFLKSLIPKSYDNSLNYTNTECIFKALLDDVQEKLPFYHKYLIVLELKLSLISKRVIQNAKPLCDESMEKMGLEFGKELCRLIQDYAEKGLFYESFIDDILEKIKANIGWICDALPYSSEKYDDHINLITVSVCFALTEIKIHPTYILALKLLPTSGSNSQYREVIARMKSFDDMEIKCYLYHIFENKEFKKSYLL